MPNFVTNAPQPAQRPNVSLLFHALGDSISGALDLVFGGVDHSLRLRRCLTLRGFGAGLGVLDGSVSRVDRRLGSFDGC